jgi:hypothetical protein
MPRTAPVTPARTRQSCVPLVDGTKLPVAWGHRFGPHLSCNRCGVRFADHIREPHRCEAPPAEAPPQSWDSRRLAPPFAP